MKVGDLVRFGPKFFETFTEESGILMRTGWNSSATWHGVNGDPLGTIVGIDRIGNLDIMIDDGTILRGVSIGCVEMIT